MGKLYIAQFPDGSKRVVADFSRKRADLFYEITRLVEEKIVHQPCGITPMPNDEYVIEPEAFGKFFVQFWEEAQKGGSVEFLYRWAEYAAGIMENITLQPQVWENHRGEVLHPQRYMLWGEELKELEDLLQIRQLERDKAIAGLPRA